MRSRSRSDRRVGLGDLTPAGSRQLGRRSSVCVVDGRLVVGRADGTLIAFDWDLEELWRADDGCSSDSDDAPALVTLASFADGVVVGERGPNGTVRLHDLETGAVRWRYDTTRDVGDAVGDTRFVLPFVVDAAVAADDSLAFVAARRYERDAAGERQFESVVLAFEPDGSVAWRFETDASPIALSVGTGADDDRLAVAYNRCPGRHEDGLVVLDGETGESRRRWNPPGDGDRRVGDVAVVSDGVVLASHADYRGYRLDDRGVSWSVDLGRPVEIDGETVYSYPNHVHATDEGAVFLTGNSYPESGRETDARHPSEHTAVGVDADGDRQFAERVGGFTHGTAVRGGCVAVPVAQHFRDRDAGRHGLCLLDVREGSVTSVETEGIVTAVALTDERVAFVEEPVSYHDAEGVDGSYRLCVEPAT